MMNKSLAPSAYERVSTTDTDDAENQNQPNKFPNSTESRGMSRPLKYIIILVLLAACAVIGISVVYSDEMEGAFGGLPIGQNKIVKQEPKSFEELKQLLELAREEHELKVDGLYGDYKKELFEKSILMEHIVSPSDRSLDRLKRRMKMRIIEAQLADVNGKEGDLATFIWAVGGHSAAAGHGNLFSQSFGAVLETVLQPIFASTGVKFYGRNFAMGGMRSAPQIALCMESIYGTDIDVLSWDFGMTDNVRTWYYDMWTNRAGRHPSKPTLMTMNTGRHQKHNAILDNTGISAFLISFAARKNLPNSNELDDPSTLPPAVQYYMCDDHYENGEPCLSHKWNTSDFCEHIPEQASWHNGWKDHMFMAYTIGSYMIEMLADAIDELELSSSRPLEEANPDEKETNPKKPKDTIPEVESSVSLEYLNYLKSLDEMDREQFLASPTPQDYKKYMDGIDPMTYDNLFRSNALCRTALLPSQSRFLGLATESGNVSDVLFAGKTNYEDEAVPYSAVPPPRHVSEDGENNPLWLSYDDNKRKNVCDYAQIDSKDFFLAREEDGWMKMTVPNKLEKNFYIQNDESKPSLGMLVLCTRLFDWGRFPPDYMPLANMTKAYSPNKDETYMTVNGVDVTNTTNIDDMEGVCHILKNSEGYYFPTQPPNSVNANDVEYEIKVRVPLESGRLYLTDVIIF